MIEIRIHGRGGQGGVTLAKLELYEQSVEAFETCLKLAPLTPAAHRWLATIYGTKLHRPDKAIGHRARLQEVLQRIRDGRSEDTDDAAICAAILAMSQQLGLIVVAEGVETREQLDFLRRHKCDHIQGYICSKPLPAAEFFALLLKLSGKAANSDNPVGSTSEISA